MNKKVLDKQSLNKEQIIYLLDHLVFILQKPGQSTPLMVGIALKINIFSIIVFQQKLILGFRTFLSFLK